MFSVKVSHNKWLRDNEIAAQLNNQYSHVCLMFSFVYVINWKQLQYLLYVVFLLRNQDINSVDSTTLSNVCNYLNIVSSINDDRIPGIKIQF